MLNATTSAFPCVLRRRGVARQSQGASVKRIATTRTGLSKLMDIQHNKFIALSCHDCGYTELYNPEVLEGKNNFGTIIDILFGG